MSESKVSGKNVVFFHGNYFLQPSNSFYKNLALSNLTSFQLEFIELTFPYDLKVSITEIPEDLSTIQIKALSYFTFTDSKEKVYNFFKKYWMKSYYNHFPAQTIIAKQKFSYNDVKKQILELNNNLKTFDLNKVEDSYFYSTLHNKNEEWYLDIFNQYNKSGKIALLEFASAHVFKFRISRRVKILSKNAFRFLLMEELA